MLSKWRKDLSSRLGVYRFMPLFFVLGAAIELFMIKVRVGNETFYDTVIRKESERRLKERMPWGNYLKALTASMISMLAGAAVVHSYYKPNLKIPDVPPSPSDAVADENLEGFKKIISLKKTD